MESKGYLKAIGDRIRAIRKDKGLSQEKLAELAGIHFTFMSDIENGKRNASIYSYYSIASALDITLSELVNLPISKADQITENELAVILSKFRGLDKKKQALFLAGAGGMMNGFSR